MKKRKIIAVIDIGAGRGAKTALFDLQGNCLLKGFLPVSAYGRSGEVMVDRLVKHLKKLVDRSFHSSDDLIAVGVDMPGVISDGQVYICSNLPFLAGVNIGALFEQRFTCPVVIINDGESGGLMEWRVRKKELLYWVIGGGWGGAWINAEGGVTCKGDFCEARDRALFLVNEPGYATGISEKMLGEIFEEYGLSPARFCYYFIKHGRAIPWQLMDPHTGLFYIRAESIISNRGLYCLFQTVIEHPQKKGMAGIQDHASILPDRAGMEIYKLCLAGHDEALKAMEIFGRIFGEVAVMVTRRAKVSGAPDNIPIYLSGGLANSFDIFGKEMRRPFMRNGDKSEIEPSYFLDKEMNTNIMGSYYIARDAVYSS